MKIQSEFSRIRSFIALNLCLLRLQPSLYPFRIPLVLLHLLLVFGVLFIVVAFLRSSSSSSGSTGLGSNFGRGRLSNEVYQYAHRLKPFLIYLSCGSSCGTCSSRSASCQDVSTGTYLSCRRCWSGRTVEAWFAARRSLLCLQGIAKKLDYRYQ